MVRLRAQPRDVRHDPVARVLAKLELALAEGRAYGEAAASNTVWCPPGELDRLALPTLMKKLLRLADVARIDI